MQEAYGWKNEDLLWAGTALWGGIAGQQGGTCGAVATAAVCLGLRHRRPPDDKEAVARAHEAACNEAREMAREFVEKFGALSCIELVGVDLSNQEAIERAVKAGRLERCHDFIRFVVGKLYELEAKRDK
jgi:C_GCAxxG_C_C family probable redox protein